MGRGRVEGRMMGCGGGDGGDGISSSSSLSSSSPLSSSSSPSSSSSSSSSSEIAHDDFLLLLSFFSSSTLPQLGAFLSRSMSNLISSASCRSSITRGGAVFLCFIPISSSRASSRAMGGDGEGMGMDV